MKTKILMSLSMCPLPYFRPRNNRKQTGLPFIHLHPFANLQKEKTDE